MFMSTSLLSAFVLFAFVSSITPGPNNTMLLASGVNFGFRRSMPHALGISIGFMLLVICVGLGLGEVFKVFPWAYTLLRYVGAAYLLYLAWKIANAGGMSDSQDEQGKPMTFLGAAAFQWVNPKAWIMALGGDHHLHAGRGLCHQCAGDRPGVRRGEPAECVRMGWLRQRPAQCAARAALVAGVQLVHGWAVGVVAVPDAVCLDRRDSC